MNKGRLVWGAVSCLTLCAFVIGMPRIVYAESYTGTSYKIDASVTGGFGGSAVSTNYGLVSAGGESIVGNGTGGSYIMGQGYVSQLQKSLQLTLQPNGLVAGYQLDEGAGLATYDNSSYGGGANLVDTPTWTTGKLGGGILFNGSSQAVDVGNPSHLQLMTQVTLSAWVKTSTATGSQGLITKASNFWMALSSGRLAIYDWTTSVTCTDLTTNLADDTWHYVAVALDSGVTDGSVIYVDGTAKKTCTWTPQYQSGRVVLGAVSTGASTHSQYLNGALDHAKIFNRILTASEIAAEFNAQNGGVTSGLTLGAITPGASNTALYDAIIQTDSGGYSLAVQQNQNLTNGSYTIPSVSGSIASPLTWSEGATKGLGFTLVSTTGTAIPGKWSSGSAYSAFPATLTSFYTRTGTPSGRDVLAMRLRADVDTSQASGSYTNTITVSGTITP